MTRCIYKNDVRFDSEGCMKNKQQKITELVQKIPFLTDGQVFWLDKILTIFQGPHTFQILQSDLIDNNALDNLGDALRIHHSFSAEPFSKDKFEYVLETVLKMSGHQAQLAPKGNRGHDITVDGKRISLKTQANKTIRDLCVIRQEVFIWG